MTEYEDGNVIEPESADLDPATIRTIQHAIRGFFETEPKKSPTEMSSYRPAKHDAYSAIMSMIYYWLEEIEENN